MVTWFIGDNDNIRKKQEEEFQRIQESRKIQALEAIARSLQTAPNSYQRQGEEGSIESHIESQIESRELVNSACIDWASRGYLPGYNMDDFLTQFNRQYNGTYFLSKACFKRALQAAHRDGLIEKRGKRYCPKTCS